MTTSHFYKGIANKPATMGSHQGTLTGWVDRNGSVLWYEMLTDEGELVLLLDTSEKASSRRREGSTSRQTA